MRRKRNAPNFSSSSTKAERLKSLPLFLQEKSAAPQKTSLFQMIAAAKASSPRLGNHCRAVGEFAFVPACRFNSRTKTQKKIDNHNKIH